MRILVSGGTGQIGSVFTKAMLEQGHQVAILSRRAAGSGAPQDEALAGAELVGWDGRNVGPWAAELARADAVVNLAGENIGGHRWTAAHKARVLDSRVQAGRALASAIQQSARKPSVLVQSSAVGYYGPRGDEEVSEDAPIGGDFMAGICREWEGSTQPVEALGVRRVVIRSAIVLSKGAGALPRMALPFRLFAGGPLGSGRQWLPWIHPEDEVAAIAFLIQHEAARGAFNLCAPEPLTNADFGRTLAKVLQRPYWLPAPAFALRLLLGEMSTMVLDGQRAVPSRLLAAGFRFRFPRAEAALWDIFKSP